jgi:hypothetical protein
MVIGGISISSRRQSTRLPFRTSNVRLTRVGLHRWIGRSCPAVIPARAALELIQASRFLPRCSSLSSEQFVKEQRPIVPNDCACDTSVVILVANDPTSTREEHELSEERCIVSILVLLATCPSPTRGRSVTERSRGPHAPALLDRTTVHAAAVGSRRRQHLWSPASRHRDPGRRTAQVPVPRGVAA